MRGKSLYSVLILSLVFLSGNIRAQERASIQALATVVSSLSILGTNNLQFGTVTPGLSKAVDKGDIGFAGEWTITGNATAEITLDLTLPTQLQTSDSLGLLDISFAPNDASYSDGTGSQTTPNGVINPNGPSTQRIGAGGQMFFWIGGMVSPRISQTGGDYSADITLTIAYTGS